MLQLSIQPPHVIVQTIYRQNKVLLYFLTIIVCGLLLISTTLYKYQNDNVQNQQQNNEINELIQSGQYDSVDTINSNILLQQLIEARFREVVSELQLDDDKHENTTNFIQSITSTIVNEVNETINRNLNMIQKKSIENETSVTTTGSTIIDYSSNDENKLTNYNNSVLRKEIQTVGANVSTNNDDDNNNINGTTTTTTTTTIANTVHVLYGLVGNETGFLHEFEISLKSVLLNAPYYSNLHIHIMANNDAYNCLDIIFYTIANLTYWKTKHNIIITTYNVELYINEWSEFIEIKTNYPIYNQTSDHTIGTYFRLFAHTVLPLDIVKYILYIDTDVVIMANLDNVWQYTTYTHDQHVWKSDIPIETDNSTTTFNLSTNGLFNSTNNFSIYSNNSDPFFMWGLDECAGFVIINLHELDTIWELVSQMDLYTLSWDVWDWISDQFILRMISMYYPYRVAILSNEWDVSIAGKSGLWKGNLLDRRPNGIGMLHFNGGGSSKASAYHTSDFITNTTRFQYTWNNALYYINLPWIWTKFIIESHINPYLKQQEQQQQQQQQSIPASITTTTDSTRIRSGKQEMTSNSYPIVINHRTNTS